MTDKATANRRAANLYLIAELARKQAARMNFALGIGEGETRWQVRYANERYERAFDAYWQAQCAANAIS